MTQKIFETRFSSAFRGKMLDGLLGSGWFRGGAMMHRHALLHLDHLDSVVNLRFDTFNTRESKRLRKIIRKNNHFEVRISPYRYSTDLEELYQLTSYRFQGYVHGTFLSYMNEHSEYPLFDNWKTEIYDQGHLVAASVFNLGEKSVMSLIGMYRPEVRKYSPGVFSMICEMQFAWEQGFRWYYPGYILHESGFFDYKLFLGEEYAWYKTGQSRWFRNYQKLEPYLVAPMIRSKNEGLLELLMENGFWTEHLEYTHYMMAEQEMYRQFCPLPQVILTYLPGDPSQTPIACGFDYRENAFLMGTVKIRPAGDFFDLSHADERSRIDNLLIMESPEFFYSPGPDGILNALKKANVPFSGLIT